MEPKKVIQQRNHIQIQLQKKSQNYFYVPGSIFKYKHNRKAGSIYKIYEINEWKTDTVAVTLIVLILPSKIDKTV